MTISYFVTDRSLNMSGLELQQQSNLLHCVSIVTRFLLQRVLEQSAESSISVGD